MCIKFSVIGAIELKELVKIKLENADERVLRIVDSVLNEYSKENEDNADEILLLLKESEKEYAKGNNNFFQEIIDRSRKKHF